MNRSEIKKKVNTNTMKNKISKKDVSEFEMLDYTMIVPDESNNNLSITSDSKNLCSHSKTVLNNLTGIITDLESQLKKQEKMLHTMIKSEGRYQVISKSSSDFAFSAKITSSQNFTLEWVSACFEEEMGFCFSQLLDSSKIINHLYQEDLGTFNKSLQDLCDGKISSNEVRLNKKNGETQWYQFSLYPTLNENNEAVKFYGVCSSISDRKKSERELLDQNYELEKRIEEMKKQLDVTAASLKKEIENRMIAENKLKLLEERFGFFAENSLLLSMNYNRKTN